MDKRTPRDVSAEELYQKAREYTLYVLNHLENYDSEDYPTLRDKVIGEAASRGWTLHNARRIGDVVAIL